MHRSYEPTNAPVGALVLRSDRDLEPGELYGQTNEGNLGHGETDYRDPLIAKFNRDRAPEPPCVLPVDTGRLIS